jgi:hypothetical protein
LFAISISSLKTSISWMKSRELRAKPKPQEIARIDKRVDYPNGVLLIDPVANAGRK